MVKKERRYHKKVMSPLLISSVRYLISCQNVLTGFLVLKLLDWIKDPRKFSLTSVTCLSC